MRDSNNHGWTASLASIVDHELFIVLLLSLAACGRSVGRSVSLSLCTHVFSRTVAAVDTKRGYVGMCNGRSAQQESGTS